jgi:hypothetical protein
MTLTRALLVFAVALALIDCAIDCGVRTDGGVRENLREGGLPLTPRLAR